eukprot:CAMPEP_0114382268 /NCGR_PEP_ID=MMETSP0102-20121206/3984_1 /TAXON_ID=38822 ORGANISM="Pteridomonas danica, Strain PT" /NCGR_SAMPLE_ID=MMETSP0102 /ASSEMBLY_ACC=CAM_ASM_000212 /LENGTH=120 /DNA_ID=CAMNT_0001537989 /DNA_START=94 /DNA_END=453 /DNA_ORIENTATION=+
MRMANLKKSLLTRFDAPGISGRAVGSGRGAASLFTICLKTGGRAWSGNTGGGDGGSVTEPLAREIKTPAALPESPEGPVSVSEIGVFDVGVVVKGEAEDDEIVVDVADTADLEDEVDGDV